MDIRDFIYLTDKEVIDSSEDLITQIIAQYTRVEEDPEEENITELQPQVTVFEAITALNTLKRYQEQRIEPINQDLMT